MQGSGTARARPPPRRGTRGPAPRSRPAGRNAPARSSPGSRFAERRAARHPRAGTDFRVRHAQPRQRHAPAARLLDGGADMARPLPLPEIGLLGQRAAGHRDGPRPEHSPTAHGKQHRAGCQPAKQDSPAGYGDKKTHSWTSGQERLHGRNELAPGRWHLTADGSRDPSSGGSGTHVPAHRERR